MAMIAMLIISLLAAAAVTLAANTNNGSRESVSRRQALEASEAGLQVALYRYNMMAPSSANCVGDAVSTPTNGACSSSVTTLGNGSSYQYWTTPPLSSASQCVGGTVTNSVGVTNICVTSVGTSNGVSVRTEIRAASFAGTPLFSYSGLIGLQGITSNGASTFNFTEASNGPIQVNGAVAGTSNYKVVLGPQGTYAINGAGFTPPITNLNSPIVLSPVNPGNSATTNNNTAYTSTGNVSYDPTTRSFSAKGAATITFTGGVYNFCSFNVSGAATINLAPSVSAAFYIDSPSDPGSGCPQNSGTFNVSSAAVWSNPSMNPTALQIYVYGPDTGNNAITFSGASTFTGIVYAPTSSVVLNGAQIFNGAIAANYIEMDGASSFVWGPQAATLQANTQGIYYRTAWGRCPSAVSAATPMSGCS